MTSRTWLAVILCCFIWFTYMKWFAPIPSNDPTQLQHTTQKADSSKMPVSPDVMTGMAWTPGELRQDSAVAIKTEKLNVSFSSVGGKISKAEVLSYRQSIKKDSDFVAPVDPEQNRHSLATYFSDDKLNAFSNAKYDVRKESEKTVVLNSESAGVKIEKSFSLKEGSHFIESTIKIIFPDNDRTDWGSMYFPVGASHLEYDANEPIKSWEVVAFQNESVLREHLESFKKLEETHQGQTSWAAFGNRYFSTVVINESELNPDVIFAKSPQFSGFYFRFPVVLKKGSREFLLKLKTFVGPKDYNELQAITGLKKLIDYGTFAVFAYPLLGLLKFFYSFVHNYGLAIVLLTLLVRALFYPLSVKSMKSMKSMQKLQPQIAALKEKYKDDTARFNQEQMALFKAHKVNPAGGCLPMLVQLPVFIALYAVLGNSIDLFHAPLFGWIQDLSSKDPYYIFPVLMGLSMLGQQKLTPSAGLDPIQAKMMYMMPVVFTFIMLKLPAGLTMYIFLSTLLGIAQQLLINREKNPGTPTLTAATSATTK